MDTEQARTFLAIAAHGSFIAAASQLHLTQSTVSARIQRLEETLNARLFVRNRSGASLTPAGQRFLEYAKRLVFTAEQAIHDVGSSSRYRATLRIGGRIALWEGFLPQWVGWMRRTNPDIAIRNEIGFEDDLMRRLIEGTLDIGLMYTPSHQPGLIVEHLFNERLILVSSRADVHEPGTGYVHVDWGPGFHAQYRQSFPQLETPALVANIGWLAIQLVLANGGCCFLPVRLAQPLLDAGQLYPVVGAPEYDHPAYMVYPQKAESVVLEQAVQGLREVAKRQSDGSAIT
jgi:DNA-binding transcriptional LysR family regulator